MQPYTVALAQIERKKTSPGSTTCQSSRAARRIGKDRKQLFILPHITARGAAQAAGVLAFELALVASPSLVELACDNNLGLPLGCALAAIFVLEVRHGLKA